MEKTDCTQPAHTPATREFIGIRRPQTERQRQSRGVMTPNKQCARAGPKEKTSSHGYGQRRVAVAHDTIGGNSITGTARWCLGTQDSPQDARRNRPEKFAPGFSRSTDGIGSIVVGAAS